MTILITGANGFVGKHLCAVLERRKIQYKILTRDMIDFSLGNKLLREKVLFSLQNIDLVVHLANQAHVKENSLNVELAKKVNVEGTFFLATMAKEFGVKKFIFLSSTKVYGDNYLPKEINERTKSEPDTIYGKLKLEAENKLLELNSSNFNVTIIRSPLIYGPGVKANFLLLIKIINLGLPLPFLSVKAKKNYIFIKNLLSIILVIIKNPSQSNIYVVSDKEVVSISYLIKLISKNLDKNLILFPFPQLLLNLNNSTKKILDAKIIDSSLFRLEFNWEQPYSLVDGIKETINWYKNTKNLD